MHRPLPAKWRLWLSALITLAEIVGETAMGWERHLKHLRLALLFIVAPLAGSSAWAVNSGAAADSAGPDQGDQHWTLNFPVGEFQTYSLDSGRLANETRGPAVVYEQTVYVTDALWMRLFFKNVALDVGSFIRMTSALDGAIQELDASGLAMWQNSSCYFNGDTVYLELVAAPGSRGNQVVLERVALEFPVAGRGPCAADDCGICGTDDRVPSSELWSCRLMQIGCSASVYNMYSCLVSAGHCADTPMSLVAQFNVPSSHNCVTSNPGPADQFPITGRSFLNDGVGADWAVMTTGTNSLGQTIYQRYGQYRAITEYSVPAGTACAVWGYGVDNNDPDRSQTQQYSSGHIVTRESTYYEHDADTTYGNSGSGLINANNDNIIGIVTHCDFGCTNIATRTDRQDFVDAREALCPTVFYCSASATDTGYEHISRVQVGSIDQSSGSDGYHDYTALSTDMYIGTGYPITVTIGTAYASDIGGLWIDWNQDEDFGGPGETITTAWSGTGPYTLTITPPTGAYYGYTRMRIRVQDNAYDPVLSACGTTTYGEVEDYLVHIIQYHDTVPPVPSPMTWASPPTAASITSITMLATTAVDAASPPVAYKFDFVSGGSGGTSSDWQASPGYTDDALETNTYYTYRVRACDSASPPNETLPSQNTTASTAIETPEDISFGVPNSSSIPLNAVGLFTRLTYGLSGLYFDSVTPGGDGGINEWIHTTSDTATGLTPNTTYGFHVKARNQDGTETPYCQTEYMTTRAETPAAPTLSSPTAATMVLNVNPGANPAATEFAVKCTATSDAVWNSKFVNAAGQPAAAEVWQTDATWGAITLHSMQPSTAYTFAVKARNSVGIQTALGPGATLSTTAGSIPGACCAADGGACSQTTSGACSGTYLGDGTTCTPFPCCVGQIKGDANCDGAVNVFDIDPFVLALAEPGTWQATYQRPGCSLLCVADCNGDGAVNVFDIDAFVQCLTTGGCQ